MIKTTDLRQKLHELVSGSQSRLQQLAESLQEEEERAADLLYNHLLGRGSDQVYGFQRYMHYTTAFSGDLVLARYSPDGRLLIFHADASGHGLSATLTLMPAASAFREGVDAGMPLDQLVKSINQTLHQQLPANRFVAATLTEIHSAAKSLTVWNGAMPPVLLLGPTGECVRRFESGNMALGIMAQPEPQLQSCQLPATGRLLGFSDGLTDQRNAAGGVWGELRLLQVLQGDSGSGLLRRIIEDLQNFCGSSYFDDDVSLFVAEVGLVCSKTTRHHPAI
ncbi:MAG: serine/threonine-protein phosphatase [Marinospirillum sp.]|uniref:PP2C family protein-serine/threonine phosphatase n=1 Tax=Marinospirillum sp. TaxID=2183934 RepID=UPI0019E489B8|nr:PP2C family protein-serine/threonine phosphatase [Marinospirillum sp.]MBE0505256.1 serine/threonine-protein phosphatase [Marinospirillum sp.]